MIITTMMDMVMESALMKIEVLLHNAYGIAIMPMGTSVTGDLVIQMMTQLVFVNGYI